MVTHALVSSRLNNCNVPYVGFHLQMTWMLQLVQDTIARMLTGAFQYQHVTPILLMVLLWLPVAF